MVYSMDSQQSIIVDLNITTFKFIPKRKELGLFLCTFFNDVVVGRKFGLILDLTNDCGPRLSVCRVINVVISRCV